jgi:hypothetical protein
LPKRSSGNSQGSLGHVRLTYGRMSRTLTVLSTFALPACAAVALAACGGSSSSGAATNASGATNGASGETNSTASAQKFQQCLKDNGITLPNRARGNGGGPPSTTAPGGAPRRPGGGPGGAFGKAIQACGKYRPQGMRGGGGYGGGPGGGGGANGQAITGYLTCLKGQGLKIDTTRGFLGLRGLNRNDPNVQKAIAACRSQLPQPAGGGSSPSSPA